MIKRLTKRELGIFIICLGMVFIYLTYNALFLPLKDRIEMIKARIESQGIKLQKSVRALRKAGEVSGDYKIYLDQYRQTQSNEQMMSTILSEIQEVASGLNLKIGELKPQRVQASDFYNHFSVSLMIDSEFNQIIEFLYMLQNQPHFFNVDEAQFDKHSRRDSTQIKSRLILSKIFIPER